MARLVRRIGLLMLMLVLGALTGPAAAASPSITIVVEAGVPGPAVADVAAATEATLALFRDTYGVDLQRSLRIVLVPDGEAYVAAQMRENRVERAEAERRARTTTGWSSDDGTVLLNVGGGRSRPDRAATLGHELAHQYQTQVCGGNKAHGLMWMREGVAQVAGAQAVARAGGPTLVETRADWRRSLASAPSLAPLSVLHSESEWYAALDDASAGPVYRIAGTAVLTLADRHGYWPLLDYFARVNDSDVETAFAEAFGTSLDAFESQSEWLAGLRAGE